MNAKIMKKIADFSNRYMNEIVLREFDSQKMLSDWWIGLQFFLHRSFYQGRRDTVSQIVEQKAMKVLQYYAIGTNEKQLFILKENNYANLEQDLKMVIGKDKIGKSRDIRMIISILDFVSGLEERNIILYSIDQIKNRALKRHYKELQKIHQIGPKITSFYLRDLISLYSLEDYLLIDDWQFLQPVDTWVRKVAFKLGIIEDIILKDKEVRKSIVSMCKEYNLSPIEFNQGAWYLGYHSFDIVLELLHKI